MTEYVELTFGSSKARVGNAGNWQIVKISDPDRIDELVSLLEWASSFSAQGYFPSNAEACANAAILNLPVSAKISANTIPPEPIEPGIVY